MKHKYLILHIFLIVFLAQYNNRACNVLVDLNTFKKADINFVSNLKCDGVWAILVNSDLTNSDWSNVYKTLGPGWVVSEDNPGANSDYDRIKMVAGYVNVAMCYNETFIPPIVGSTQGIGGTILSPVEIQQQSVTHGGSIIVLTRSFEEDGWSAAVDSALQNPKVSGVALECYPNRSPLYLDSLRVKELINTCLSNNKNFYFLSPGYSNYADYMKGYISLLINEGVDFSDNRIFLVGASYDNIAPFIGGSESVEGVIKYYLSIKTRFSLPQNINKSNQFPKGFSLSQNYPNPFNPSTSIKYSIPKTGNITLKLYNLLGKEVATLVNQEQKAGSYTISLNAEHLASGIYLYKISESFFDTPSYILSVQSTDFSLVKKMTLLK